MTDAKQTKAREFELEKCGEGFSNGKVICEDYRVRIYLSPNEQYFNDTNIPLRRPNIHVREVLPEPHIEKSSEFRYDKDDVSKTEPQPEADVEKLSAVVDAAKKLGLQCRNIGNYGPLGLSPGECKCSNCEMKKALKPFGGE